MERSQDLTIDLYNQWHARLGVDAECDAPWHHMIKSHLDPDRDIRDRRVLEIGCGRGGFATWLAQHPATPKEVVAADFSPVAVAKAKEFGTTAGIHNISWVVANIQELHDFPESCFDTVFSCETIEHVPDPPLAVRELARVLKPGGHLYLTTPNYFSWLGLYRFYCWIRGRKFDEGGQPICQVNMTFKTRRWVRQAGLEVVLTDGVLHNLPFPGRPSGIRLRLLEHPHVLMRWFGADSLIIAKRPR